MIKCCFNINNEIINYQLRSSSTTAVYAKLSPRRKNFTAKKNKKNKNSHQHQHRHHQGHH